MPITKSRESELKKEVLKLLEYPIKCFDILSNLNKETVESKLKLITNIKELVEGIYHEGIELAITTFSVAPLGKDLRRNIAYLNMFKIIESITNNAFSISKFFSTVKKNVEFVFEENWILEIASKIVRRLKLLEELIQTEDIELAKNIISKDESVNKLYKDIVQDFFQKISKNKVEIKDYKENVAGFIVTSKNFEIAGDSIKEIANLILFIIEGRW